MQLEEEVKNSLNFDEVVENMFDKTPQAVDAVDVDGLGHSVDLSRFLTAKGSGLATGVRSFTSAYAV